MIKKKPGHRVSHAWAKEDLEISDSNEVTLRGQERQDELSNDPVIWRRTDESFTIRIESEALLLVGMALLVAWFAHSFLSMSGATSLVSGVAVTVAINCPRYATKIIQWMGSLTANSKNRE
jgi:hypothetical protein